METTLDRYRRASGGLEILENSMLEAIWFEELTRGNWTVTEAWADSNSAITC